MRDSVFLREIPIFVNLDDEDLSKISKIVSEVSMKAGKVLFKQGEPGDAFYLIKTGSVEIIKTIDNKEVKIASLKKGDFFGETALLDGEPRTASIKIDSDSVLYKIAKEDFDFLMRVNLSISLKIMKEVNKRLKDEQKKVYLKEEAEKRQGKIITLFSTKGGSGKSMTATNLALLMKKGEPEKEIAIVDLDLQFGDIALYLNLDNKKKNILELLDIGDDLGVLNITEKMILHESGIWVLPGPSRPEYAEKITRQLVVKLFEIMKKRFDYIIVDTASYFQDISIQAMDISDTIYVVTTLDLASIKNAKQSMDLMNSLNYGSDKVKVLVNRDSERLQIRPENVEGSLSCKLIVTLPEEPELAILSVNAGKPLALMAENSAYVKKMMDLVKNATGIEPKQAHPGLFDKIKEIYGSVSKWKKVTEMQPEYAQAYYALGLAYKTKGLLDEAIIEYKRSIELNPDYADAHFWLGRAYEKKDMLPDAVTAFKSAVEINPNYKEALAALGATLNRLGETEEAVAILERAKVAKRGAGGEYADIHMNLGVAYFQKGENEMAIEELNKAVEINPKYTDAFMVLAQVNEATGQLEQSINCYKMAQESTSDDAIKRKIQDKLMRVGNK